MQAVIHAVLRRESSLMMYGSVFEPDLPECSSLGLLGKKARLCITSP